MTYSVERFPFWLRIWILIWILMIFFPLGLRASGKKILPASGVFDGKKAVALGPVQDVQIEMPDGSEYDFGENLKARLITLLTQSGKYEVVDEAVLPRAQRVLNISNRFHWNGSFVPSATLHFEAESLNFQTGSRGEKMFYGFDERFRTPFNGGQEGWSNEFPMRPGAQEPSWFGQSFIQKGIDPFDSRSGLDLGDGLSLDILYAWLLVKYARYKSELHMRVIIDHTLEGTKESRLISVTGNGFFFDVSGKYDLYSAGISVARTDAMKQAFDLVIAGSYGLLDQALQKLPLYARIDGILPNGTLLLGTGTGSQVRVGLLYEVLKHPQVAVQVDESVMDGAIGHIVQGNPVLVSKGDILRNISKLPAALSALGVQPKSKKSDSFGGVDQVQIPSHYFAAPDLKGLVPKISRRHALLKSLKESIFLPYRIWRYMSYHQSYHLQADSKVAFKAEDWVRQIGLDQVTQQPTFVSQIALIDSGIDYNHPMLHEVLWLNPSPQLDPQGRKDRYGWDFISGDSRSYDDGYHGTQLASLMVAVYPQVKIMPLKIFNPWGITNSASIYAAFIYAVDHGAQVIVCGWTTSVASKAIEMGVSYARDHGVLVVAAAGDEGSNLEVTPAYPVSLAQFYDNVLGVAAVNGQDQPLRDGSRVTNFNPLVLKIAAPGYRLSVAEPRSSVGIESSTSLATALVAGALARVISLRNGKGNYQEWTRILLESAVSLPSLYPLVQGGLRLEIHE